VALAGLTLALCAWCGWVSGFHRSTTPARVTWGVSLAAVVAIDVVLWRGGRGSRLGVAVPGPAPPWPVPGRPGTSPWVGVAPWVGLAAVVAAWDIAGLDTSTHEAHLTISALTQAFRPLNAAMLLVWMAVGIGYGVVRARAPGDAAARHVAGAGRPDAARWQLWPWLPAVLLPDSRGAGVAFWLGVVAAAVVIDQLARRSGGRLADAEQFLRLVTDPLAARLVLVAAWGYAGYHLFAH
jgi:hypothetical protein